VDGEWWYDHSKERKEGRKEKKIEIRVEEGRRGRK
jgi:hypothetical protein